jgi:hypothetical protein
MAGLVALIVAAFFTGASFYVGFAEQPARLALDDAAMLSEWKTSCKRGFATQAPLCVLGCLLGLAAWWQTGAWGFMIGAIAMIANGPWTELTIIPTNRALTATETAVAGPATRALMVTWGRRHAVRTALGVVALAAFFSGCVSY